MQAVAEVAVFEPVADTTLFEVAPTNSLGGAQFVNAGTTQNYTRNRGLFRFDPLAKVPVGARVTRVTLQLEVERRPRDGFAATQMGLYRMRVPWGEGSTVPRLPDTSPGLGGFAVPGDATWTHRFYGSTNTWTQPGGAEEIDYTATPSSLALIYSVEDSPYLFESTAALVADLQLWVDHPEANFGWMLRSVNEGPNFTARRFGSRESGLMPLLEVEYVPPTIALGLTIRRVTDGALLVLFQAEPSRAYRLEGSPTLLPLQWSLVRDFPALPQASEHQVELVAETPQRYYRLVSIESSRRLGRDISRDP